LKNRNSLQQLDEARQEIDRLTNLHTDSESTAEQLDAQKRKMHEEIRQLKKREQCLTNDYSELEEENITLQKQVKNNSQFGVNFFQIVAGVVAERSAS
jgi:protein bicaudal D